MRNSKFLLTSLLAAATMSVPAFAWTTDTNGLPDTSGISPTSTKIADEHTVTADTIYNFTNTSGTENSPVTVTLSNGADVKLNAAAGTMMAIGSISGTGDVWFAQGRWRYNTNSTFNSTGTIYMQGGQFWVTEKEFTTSNDVVLGSSAFSEGISSLDNAALRVGADVRFTGTTTVVENAKIGFQNGKTLTIDTLSGNGNITTGRYGGTNNFVVASANDFTGNISIVDGVSLTWSSSTATFGGLSGNGSVTGDSYLNIKDAQDTTFSGTVGSSTSGVALALSGSGTQAFTGTNYFSTVSVSDTAKLDLRGSTTTISGSFTTEDNATLVLGGLSADTAAIVATGDVTLSADTIFDISSYVENAKLVSSSGTLTAADVTSGEVDRMGISNLYSDGDLVNQRGSATFSVTNGVLTLTSYTAGESWSITWNGGDSGVWKVNGSGWVKTSETSTPANFQHGDSVTFSTEGASVMVSGTVKPAAMTVSENTTFKGTDATISVAKNSLTISGSATLGIDSGVTLDLGSGSDAIGASDAKLNLSGSGTVKYVFTGTSGTGSGVFIADTFTGTLDYYGNLNWSQWAGGSPISFSDSVTVRLSKAEGQTSAGFWGGAGRTFKNDFIFGSDYEINLGGGNLTFEGSVTASGSTLSITGSNTLTFSGTTTMDKIVNNGKTRVEGGATLNITGAGTNDNGSLNWKTFEVGAGSSVNVTADFKASAWSGSNWGVKALNVEEGATLSVGGSMRNAAGLTLNNGGLITAGTIDYSSAEGWRTNTFSGNGYIVADTFNVGNTTQVVFENQTFVVGGFSWSWYNNTPREIRLGNATFGAKQDWSTDSAFTLTGSKDNTVSADDVATTTVFNTGAFDAGSKTFSETAGHTITLGGVLSGKGGIKKAGAGTLKLSGNNTFEGGVKLEAGTLELGHNNALGNGTYSALTVTGDSELKLGGGLNVANNVVFDNSAGTVSTLTINVAADTELSGGLISYYQNEIRKVGAGTLTLSGENQWFSHGTISIEKGTILAKSANALSAVAEASNNKVRLSGGQLEVGSGVTLAQTNIEIVLCDAYSSMAAITGKGALAADATITIADIQAAAIAAESALGNDSWTFQIATADSTIAASLAKENFVLAEALQGTWQISDYANGMLTITIPEPSTFGLLAGLGALALAGTRRRRKKA